MFLKNRENGDLVEILDISALVNPNASVVAGRYHAGEEMQEPTNFDKGLLQFPSDEALPRWWLDASYRA